MSTGFQVFNEQGIEIVNSSDPMPFVWASGTVDGSVETTVVLNYPGWPETPVVWIRPRAGNFYSFNMYRYSDGTLRFGAFNTSQNGLNYRVPYDWAVTASASAIGYGGGGGDGYGIEVFDAQGRVTFSSTKRFARITHIQTIKAPYYPGGMTTTAGISYPFSEMPWLQMNMACSTLPAPAGEYAISESFSVSVSSDFRTLTSKLSDTIVEQYNQFQNSNIYFPMALIPGL